MKFITLLLLCAPLVLPQGRGVPPPEMTVNLPAQKIGPRDLVAIQVYDSPELTRTVRISADGMLRLTGHCGRHRDERDAADCARWDQS